MLVTTIENVDGFGQGEVGMAGVTWSWCAYARILGVTLENVHVDMHT